MFVSTSKGVTTTTTTFKYKSSQRSHKRLSEYLVVIKGETSQVRTAPPRACQRVNSRQSVESGVELGSYLNDCFW